MPQVSTFKIDENLVKRHEPELQAYDDRIAAILSEKQQKNTDWQTLFTHPKLMSQFYWKDKKIHSKE